MTIYPAKDGKLELDDENSHRNETKISNKEDTMKILPENKENSGDKPIDGGNLEITLINEPVRIKTSLSHVDSKAINIYAFEVGNAFSIPQEIRLFAAYFCGVGQRSESNFWDNKYWVMNINIQRQMKGRDFLESLRVMLNNPTEKTIWNLTGHKIEDYDNDDIISIDSKMFPEYGPMKKIAEKYCVKRSNQYIELLKVPQRARTFYAGAITNTYANGYGATEKFKVSKYTESFQTPLLNISSQNIAKYAEDAKIEDYAQYMKLLGGI